MQGTEEGEGKEETELFRKASDEEKFSGLAFKIMTDPFVGSLTFLRVYSVRPQSPAPPLSQFLALVFLLIHRSQMPAPRPSLSAKKTIASYRRIDVSYAHHHSVFDDHHHPMRVDGSWARGRRL